MSLYRSPSAALLKSPSQAAFGAPFGSMSVADLGSLTRLEDKIRLLQEDLESERELRNRIERERADLSVQLIALTDRLEDAEGTTDSQIESNRKREGELIKLRKLLEESQLESEDAMNVLRKKHQDAVLDYQDQIEQLQKKNAKIDRERQRVQHEVIELTATIDQLQKDKHTAEKAAERFEAQANELANKVEDLNKHVNDLAQQRQRLQAENNDLLKEVHDQKVQLDNLQHVKYTLAQQLEEARRRLEDAERERSQLQSQLHQVQLELDSVRTALDEESVARSDAEHKLNLANTEITQWKSKFDAEVALHHEEVEDLRKKMLQKQAEYEEQIEIMLQKISQLEKAKSRLQSEVEVLIVDLEKAQNTIAILERAKEQLERQVGELKVRIDELNVELEAAQRELRAANAELQKMKHLYEKAVEQKEALARENKKLHDELHEAKEALADANRKLHELDLENARLAGEIRELQTALKEADAQRRDAENRAQRALAELQALRIEMERRLQEKEEEMEALRKNLQFEIDRLIAALADAEARMKAEISRLKKKYQAEIAELEMTVDNLNRANIEAQKTIKKQSEQLKVLQAALEDTQRQLQQVLDQYALAQRKVAALSAELEEAKTALDNAIRARKQAEVDLEEANGRISDLTSINNNLTSIKNKLETELSTAQADLDEVTKELHAADERANRALADAARAVEQLHEEQEHSMKIDALRKSLEEQVKQLQIQIQEAEAAALLGGKRVIAKLETRIRDLETALDEETRRHKETQNALRKKDRRIKEVQQLVDEEHKNFVMAQDTADRLTEKLNIQKRQLAEAESVTMQNLQRVRRYQHELEDAEGRADQAESSLHLIRAKHRGSVVTGKSSSKPPFPKIRSLPQTPDSSNRSPAITPPMHQPQQRHLSAYPALLEPTCRRRLPMPPDTHIRRSSSPRILPTPPPLSPEYRCPSAAPHLERRPSGRQLPRPPTAELSNLTNIARHGPGNSQSSLSPVSLTPDPTPDEPEFEEDVEEQEDDEVVDEEYTQEEDEDDDYVEEPVVVEPVVVTPPEEPRRISPEILIAPPPPQPRRMSKFSVHSPSIEQITSKSSSDTEDPIAHGLDPSLYSPNAPIILENNNTTVHKTSLTSNPSPTPQRPTGLGLLHCSLLYFGVRKRLRVTITKIEALAGELKPEMEIHALCKVSIPGLKGAKEQSSETKRGRDPVFNQEFFFDNVTHEELDTKIVIITACHAAGGIKGKDVVIGEASVPLRDIREMNTKKEIKIVEEIKALVPKKLGKIYTSSVIEKDSKRLTVNLKKVDALPKCGLIGAPDVCVKITLTQGTKTQTKSSRIIKSTCSAVYNEAVMFLCGTSKNELAQTSIVISVHDAQRTCTGDDTIGCAYLGVGAVDKSEIEQWKGTTEHLGKEYKGNHTLKAPAAAPPVHVAEANDDVAEEDDD